jgi:hypothetical protein
VKVSCGALTDEKPQLLKGLRNFSVEPDCLIHF